MQILKKYIYIFFSLSFILLILFIFSFGFKSEKVYAQTQDSSGIGYISTVAFGVESFPESKIDQPNSIQYDTSLVLGEGMDYIFQNYNITFLSDVNIKRRIPSVLDKVIGPPGTKINLIYFYDNYSFEDILLEKIRIPLSRNERNDGDITNLIDIDGYDDQVINTKWGNFDLYREGVGKTFVLDRLVKDNYADSFVLDSFEIKKSLNIEYWNITPDYENNRVDMEVVVQNQTNEYLNNIIFEHRDYSYTQNILPNDEVVYRYSLDMDIKSGENIDLGFIKIADTNTNTECAVVGSNWYQYYYTNAISSYSYFNNSWFSGAYVQPTRDSMCIQRLPYVFTSENIVFEYEDDVVDNDVENSNENTDNSSNNEDLVSSDYEKGDVLGVDNNVFENLKELPKTSKKNIFFLLCLLVADIYLWYSLFNKRRKYESKNKSARLCTKSSNGIR